MPAPRSSAPGASARLAARLAALVLVLFVTSATSAAAAPVVVSDAVGTPGADGYHVRTVTLAADVYEPGEAVRITGEGFRTAGSSGRAKVGLKVNDDGLQGWTYEDDAVTPGDPDDEDDIEGGGDGGGPGGEEYATFVVREDGTFSGTLRSPETFADGLHSFRVLGGSLSTADPSDAGRTVVSPIYSRSIGFRIVTALRLGAVSPSGAFVGGGTTAVHPGDETPLALRGAAYQPGATVTATLNGEALPLASGGDVEAGGTFEAEAILPSGIDPDVEQTIAVTDGTTTRSRTLWVVPHAAGALTPRVRPGGIAVVGGGGFLGVAGRAAPQRVRVSVGPEGDGGRGCQQAGLYGDVNVGVDVPPTAAGGVRDVVVAAGTGCPGAEADEPFARTVTLPGAVAVDANAPAVAPLPDAPRRGQIPVRATGFAPNATVEVRLLGASSVQTLSAGGTIVADADGTVDAVRTVPFQTAPGRYLVLVGTGTDAVAARLCVTVPGDATSCTPTSPEPEVPTPDPDPTPTAPVGGGASSPSGGGSGGPAAIVAPPSTGASATTAPATIAAARVARLSALRGNARIRIVLRGGSTVRTTVRVRTRAKVRTTARGRARVVTLATRTVSKPGTVTLRLTKAGRQVLRRYARVRVEVRVAPRGGKAVTRVLTLRRAAR